MRIRQASAALSMILLAACGSADATPDLAVVRDSAGIAIVENTWTDSAGIPWWRLDPTPVADIGGEDAGEEYTLYQVSAAVRLNDGRIVVANGGGADVRFYGPDGTHIRTIGRRGNGPGEFQRPGDIFVLPGDTLAITDPFVRRISLFDMQGEYVRDMATSPVTGGTSFFAPNDRFADGTLVGTQSFSPDLSSKEVQRPEMVVVAMTPGGTRDTLLTVPGSEMWINVQGDASRGTDGIRSISVGRPPFRKSTSLAYGDDVIYVGTQDAPEVRIYDRDGSLRRIVRTGREMRPVTEGDLKAWIEFETADLEPAQQQARRESILNGIPGEVVPPYGSVEVDREGNLWISDFDARVEPRGRWTVYDGEGRAIARIQLPAGFRVQEIGADYVLGIERDELDVEHVRLYRLLRAGE